MFRINFCKHSHHSFQIAVPSGGVGVVELEDEHGVTTDEETMIRISHNKRYKIQVTACSQDVGERRIPIVIVFYHDTYSELAPVAEGAEEEKLVSLMAVEAVVRVHTPELEAMLPLQPYVARERRVEYWRARETVKGHTPAQVFQEEADYLVTKLPWGTTPWGRGSASSSPPGSWAAPTPWRSRPGSSRPGTSWRQSWGWRTMPRGSSFSCTASSSRQG